MPFLRFGLNAGALVVLLATVASSWAGYTVEVALLRGLLAFPLVAFVAFFAELVVATSPAPADDAGVAESDRPVDLAQVRAEREAASERQAA